MFLFALSIFLSAFLLFQVQPMIGKFILPWFGGTPAVWSTAMLFFQVFLTGGYAYAYWLVKQRRQGRIHVAFLVVTVALLAALGLGWPSPVTPSADMRPGGVDFPVVHILFLLTVSVGLPYFILAANGPLMQAWFSRAYPSKSYARLYALSNAGSLLGLLIYPALIEPALTLFQQGWAWTAGFLLFVLVVFMLSRRAWDEAPAIMTLEAAASAPPSLSMRVLWILSSGLASLFLLSTTNQVSQEVAVIPFLWVAPLAVYLLSFIFAFSDLRLYERRVYAVLFGLASLGVLWVMLRASSLAISIQIGAYLFLLFLACMVCHAELYLLRPRAEHLTNFYLMVSLGGAAGGIFVNLIAPFLFKGYWEFYLGWFLVFVFLVVKLLPRFLETPRRQALTLSLAAFAGMLVFAFGLNQIHNTLFAERNFYGIIRVRDWGETAVAMVHGATVHGVQYLDDRARPTTYFVEDSGVGLLLNHHPRKGRGLRVGVLGLGAGTLAVFGQEGDSYRFYEINPVVIDLAKGEGGYFTFLTDSKAEIEIVPGDARISLERELAQGERQNFDVLVLDTFSSDSIPVHLVTQETFALYLQHLASNGVIAAHISNRHLDLQPVLFQLAQEFGLSLVKVDWFFATDYGGFPSQWILMERNSSILEIPEIKSRADSFEGYTTDIRLWTDDYSNLFQILK
ncbi:MAG: fused MFS/spermidine synthase [Chloroflexi bacterium]|nr:fused MFS/spermidine synthase [Chloroflexota bacterium]